MKNTMKRIFFASLLSLFIISCSSDSDNDSSSPNNPTDPTAANKEPLGTSANDFLSDVAFTSMRVELAYVEGFKPTQTTINNLLQYFEDRLNKPDGVTIKETVVPATTDGTLDTDEYVAIENANRTVYNTGDELGVWIFFADQNSEKDEGNSVILGTAYRNTSCIIFEKTLREIDNRFASSSLSMIESVTTQHEFGHMFGLVDLGTPMQQDHLDEENDKHCTTEDCLMYFQTVTDIADMVGLSSVPDYDEFCLADLQANGGK